MGIFIDLEGLDGSGKTTQTELICKRLAADGIDYRQIKLPDYESDSSILVRKYLAGDFGKNAGDVNAYAASVLYAADRFASYTEKWKAEYKQGKLIFADRYTPANAIYQMTKLPEEAWDEFLDWLFDFEYRLMGLPAPDKVVFLDMPSEHSFSLLNKRQGDGGDIHEKDHEYLKKCRENALDICERYGWARISCADENGVKSREAINAEVFAAINGVLGIE